MIADCAVDPEVFAIWQHFSSLYEDFGVPRGRIISRFPKSWPRIVLQRVDELEATGANSTKQAAKIRERFASERFKRKLKSPGGRTFDPSKSWLECALAADPAFDLIVAAGMAAGPNMVGAEFLLKDESPFHRVSQSDVRRKKEDLVAAAALLLGATESVVIVDPNFRADEERFYETIRHLLAFLVSSSRIPKRFEIHTKRVRNPKEVFSRKSQEFEWNKYLVPFLPKGLSVNVCFWDKLPSGGKPHARFLLTQSGGLYYDQGIDEGDGETLVTLLEDAVWETLCGIYNASSLPLDFGADRFLLRFDGL
jgi:hypothetical protein